MKWKKVASDFYINVASFGIFSIQESGNVYDLMGILRNGREMYIKSFDTFPKAESYIKKVLEDFI